MTAEAPSSPSPRILCPECSNRLFVIWKMGRWTVCPRCDAGWLRDFELDTVQRFGPPVVLRIEGRVL